MVHSFRLPIETVSNKPLEKNIITDIELSEENDQPSLYKYLFRYSNKYGKNMIEKWNKVYTDDVSYLKDTKKMIKSYNNNTKSNVCDIWDDLKSKKNFVEKYYYIDWDRLKFLNNYSSVHQILSIYRMISPICTLILPIIILLSSWFILRFSGIKMSFSQFVGFLKTFIKTRTSFGKIAQNFYSAKPSSKCYAIFSVIMYFVQIYNNITIVINFNKNLGEMHNYIDDIKKYLITTIDNMKYYSNLVKDYPSYKTFNCELSDNIKKIEDMIVTIKDIPKTHKSTTGVYYVGYVQKIIYNLYHDKEINKVMDYSFGFNGYIDNLNGIKENLKLNYICYATFNATKPTGFTDAYYPPLIENTEHSKIVKNTYKLDKEVLVSGPNASGKTTVLKTTLFNIICSQQLGIGFYKKANVQVYSNIFCYLNIPDTSGRDSLFQAEARRCVEILEKISLAPKENTFCIFDELYSGTNHYEAISSAFSFLDYLVNNHNFHFMMSTHFIDLCKKLEDRSDKITNMMMTVTEEKEDFIYSYKLKGGISHVKGGVKVLKDLN